MTLVVPVKKTTNKQTNKQKKNKTKKEGGGREVAQVARNLIICWDHLWPLQILQLFFFYMSFSFNPRIIERFRYTFLTTYT